jgi:hypothetical protein
VIEEEPHAEGFGALHGNQPHLPAGMIAVCELGYQRFIVFGIPLEAGDPFFDHTAKAGADFEPFIGGDIGDHCRHLDLEFLRSKIISSKPSTFFFLCRY